MTGQGLSGPPILREPGLSWHPARPEEHLGEIIDIDNTNYQLSSVDDLIRPLNKDEEGIVNRYVEEEKNKRLASGEYQRDTEYRKEFEKDPQHYFIKLLTETTREEWNTKLQEAMELISRIQSALAEKKGAQGQKFRNDMGMTGMGRLAQLNERASDALGKLLDRMANSQEADAELEAQINSALQQLTRTQVVVKTELLSSNATTNFDDLSEETKGFIFQEFLAYKRKFDEGGDKRTATIRVLLEMRKNAPYKVFEGRDRFFYIAWKEANEAYTQLQGESDPQKRAALKKRIEDAKNTMRTWSSSLSGGGYNGRMELGAVGLFQAQNSAWAKVQHTLNRLRKPNGETEFTVVLQSAGYGQSSWESQYLESDIYLQFGTTWNAFKRLSGFTPDEHEAVRDAFFNKVNKEEWKKIETQVDEKIQRELNEAREATTKARNRVEELTRELTEIGDPTNPGADTRIAEITKQISDLDTYIANIENQLADPNVIKYASTQHPGKQKGGQQGGQPQVSIRPEIIRSLREERDQFKEERQNLANTKQKLIARHAELSGLIKQAEVDRDRIINTQYDWYQPLDPDGSVNNTPNTAASIEAALTQRRLDARQRELERLNREADKRYNAFKKKLEDYTSSTGYVDFYTHFKEPGEVEAICNLTGIGFNYDKKTGRNILAPNITEHGTKQLKIKRKRIDPATKKVVIDPDTKEEVVDEQIIDVDFNGDYVFFNPSMIPEWNGRLSTDTMEQVLRNPDRDPAIKQLIDFAKQHNKILIALSFPVKHEIDGGMVEQPVHETGRVLDIEKVRRLKKLHGWKNVDVYRAWISNQRIQEELGIRPDELLARIVADRARMHAWQRELLEGATVVNLSNGVTIPSDGEDDSPMSFEYMLLRQFEKFGRLSAEDVDEPGFYQYLPRTNELAFTYNKADNTREIHWRNEVLTNNEEAPKTELDALYQSLANQLDFYENRTRYYNTARTVVGEKDYDEVIKIGSYIKAHMDLIANKKMRLKAAYLNPDPNLSVAERLNLLNQFREKEMAHLTYEILDARGKPKLGQRNKELWEYYNGTGQWIGKLKRNEREARERFVATALNPRAKDLGPGGISAYELAEADYNYNKDERLSWEMEVYGLGLEACGMTQNVDNKVAASMLANKYAEIKGEQILQTEERMYRAIHGYDSDMGTGPEYHWAQRAIGTFAQSAVADVGRKLILRINDMAQRHGINLKLPSDRYMLKLRPDQVSEMLRYKQDDELVKRLSRRMGNRMRTGAQESLWDIFTPRDSNLLYKDAYSPGLGWDEYGKRLFDGWQERLSDDFKDAVDRWFLLYGSEIFQDAKISGMPIRQILNTIQKAEMNDTTTLEVGLDGQRQVNPYGKKGTPLSIADGVLFNLAMEASGRPTLDQMPEDNIFVRKTQNNPTVIEQYYAELARKAS